MTVLLIVLIAGLATGITHLFLLRFKGGDIYPAYSSLRADPLGSKALYDSLQGISGLQVLRNYRTIPPFTDSRGMAFFFLGVPWRALEMIGESEAREVDALAMGGGRLVITLMPEPGPIGDSKPEEKKDTSKAPKRVGRPRRHAKGEKKVEHRVKKRISIGQRWGVEIKRIDPVAAPDGTKSMTARWSDPLDNRERFLSWHAPIVFDKLNAAWRVLARRDDHPLIIERRLGSGSVVLCSDSYLVSNEALMLEPHPEVLAWLVGDSSRVVFDEAHLGISESPGVASLARKYQLHGLIAGLILLAVLYAWKSGVSLVPRRQEKADASVHAVARGEGASAGLVNLLRRNVAVADVLARCIEEWKSTQGPSGQISREDQARIEQLLADELQQPFQKRNPVAAYNAIVKILAERKFPWKP
jgi:hypothetical protein